MREYPDRPLVGVGAVVVERGRVVLVRRAQAPLKGEWSIPGGLVELGETLRAAAEREAREETGLDVTAGAVVDVFDSILYAEEKPQKPQYHYVLVDFLCSARGGKLAAGSDAAEVRWVGREALATLDLRPATLGALEKAFAMAK